jgi:hypothetical protein
MRSNVPSLRIECQFRMSVAPQSGPLFQDTGDSWRQTTVDDLTVGDTDTRAKTLIPDMKVRWIVFVEEHPNRNSQERGDGRNALLPY